MAIDEFNLTWLSFADSCWQRYENRADYNILTCVYKVTRALCEGFLQESLISPPFLCATTVKMPYKRLAKV
jgi:hypothetical protein